ncbi:MAG: right-handed parallel beta-helix repeat-containing protein, partial [Candidatus Thorarchaeota archaeon]|nr:right-handed parallel beta-helix repeat-containing protein [Candidatus Thorarchaeota archaeon]
MKIRVVGLIVLILFAGGMLESPAQVCAIENQNQLQPTSELSIEAQTSDPIIYVNTESGFQTLGFPGNGTETNPYRIENYGITSSSVCISIIGTTSFFMIRNCTFKGIGTGVRFSLISNGRIENCTFLGYGTGIKARYSDNSSIESCYFPDVEVGMMIEDSSNINITDVNVNTENYRRDPIGVHIIHSSQVLLANSSISDNSGYSSGVGVRLENTNDSVIHKLLIEGVDRGIEGMGSQRIYSSNIIILKANCGILWGMSEDSFFEDCLISIISSYANPLRLYDSSSTGFQNCIFICLYEGSIDIWDSELCSFINCSMENSTVNIKGNIQSAWVHSFIDVTIDGLLLGYYRTKSNLTVDLSKFSQIIIVDSESLNLNPTEVDSVMAAIDVAFSSNITIQNVRWPMDQKGSIGIMSSNNVTLINSSLSSTEGSLSIVRSHYSRVSNISSDSTALWIIESTGCIIEESSFSRIEIDESFDCTFRNSRFMSEYISAYLMESTNCRFNNIQFASPIDVYGRFKLHWDHIFENVTIAGFPLGYFFESNNSLINSNDFGYLYLYYCNNNTIQGDERSNLYSCRIEHSNNLVIENLEFEEQGYSPLYLWDCNGVTLRDLVFKVDQDFWLIDSDFIALESCEMIDNMIDIFGGSHITIEENAFTNCSLFINGLFNATFVENDFRECVVEGSYLSAVTISNNRFVSELSGFIGVVLTQCSIIGNEFECHGIAVDIEFSDDLIIAYNSINGALEGINMTDSRLLRVYRNIISDCRLAGIVLSNSEACEIRGNQIARTISYGDTGGNGISIEYCTDMLCTMNILLGN